MTACSPCQRDVSSLSRISARAPAGCSSVMVSPAMVRVIAMLVDCFPQSASTAQSGGGGVSGGVASPASSYRRIFWLLEPAFSTRIFITHLPCCSVGPGPVSHLRHILQVLAHIRVMFREHGVALLDQGRHQRMDARGTLHSQLAEVIATDLVEHNHIERRGRRALLIKTAHMEAFGVRASVNQFVDRALV